MPAAEHAVVVLDEFLAPQELGWLWNYALAHEGDFVVSNVIGADEEGIEDHNHRRSRVLYELDGFHDLFGGRILQFLPYVMSRLRHDMFSVANLEVQLTASNDGEFFRPHQDRGDGPVSTREITFVYFCHREPCAFSGGQLRIWAGASESDDVLHIRPAQNMVVFFQSDRLHEITPVSCPSRAFTDSRFTVNGWLHR